MQMTFGFLSDSKNFCKLLWVSCEVFVLHGFAWILHVLEFRHPPNFLWILAQPLRDFRACTTWVGRQRIAPFHLGFHFIRFWIFIGLVNIGSPWSLINRSWHNDWRDVTLSSILSFSSLSITYCRWRRRAGRRCWAMTLLSWKCPRSWWVRSTRRIWQAWNHNKNEVLRAARNPNPVLLRCGFWPLIHS